MDSDTWTMDYIQDNKVSVYVHTFGNTSEVNSEYTIYDVARSLGVNIRDSAVVV